MAALNISPADVRSALTRNNYLAAVGSTKGSLLQVNLTANTDLHTADQFRQLVVRQDKGTLIRLGDIADVVLGAEDYNTEVRFSGQKAVFMGIWVLPNANSVDVIKRVRVELDQIKKELPTGMTAEMAYDATAYINDAIHEVVKTLIDTLLIVMVVIFLFLGSFRSVIVPVVAIPISLIGALFLMQLFGFTLNLLTLLAIVLSVGLVVDDASARIDRAHHRDDDYAGGGLYANRAARWIDWCALSRIRAHFGGRSFYFRCRCSCSLAHDVSEFIARRTRRCWIQRLGQSDVRPVPQLVWRASRSHIERAAGSLCGLGRDLAPRNFHVPGNSKSGDERISAKGRSGSDFWDHYRAGECDH